MQSVTSSCPTIGIFDSGVGGLTVLRALRARLHHAQLHYVADSAYAPYGGRSADEVIARCERLTTHLLAEGARMVIVACNTATTLAIHALRARWPELAFVGVEPGIKPAVLRSRSRRIGVLATQHTVNSQRLNELVQMHASDCEVTLQACPGLADAIEAGVHHHDEIIEPLLRDFCAPLMAAQVDTVVLGCTHYPLVAHHIRQLMGSQVQLVDTAEAVAQRAQTVWRALDPPADTPTLRLQTTGEPHVLTTLSQCWLGTNEVAQRVTL